MKISDEQKSAWQALAKINEQSLHPGGLLLTKEALDFCKLSPKAKILDVGCGTGKSLEYLLSQAYTAQAVDSSLDLLLNSNLPVIQADMQALPFENQSFEAVFYECVLSLATDKVKALDEAKRVLQDHGKLILSDLFVLDNEIIKDISNQHFCSQGALNLTDLQNILIDLGFVLCYQADHSKALKELVANLVWHYGSSQALFGNMQTSCASVDCHAPKKINYKLIIAEKR